MFRMSVAVGLTMAILMPQYGNAQESKQSRDKVLISDLDQQLKKNKLEFVNDVKRGIAAIRSSPEDKDILRQKAFNEIDSAVKEGRLDDYMMALRSAKTKSGNENHVQPFVYQLANIGASVDIENNLDSAKASLLVEAKIAYGTKGEAFAKKVLAKYTKPSAKMRLELEKEMGGFRRIQHAQVTDEFPEFTCNRALGFPYSYRGRAQDDRAWDGATRCLRLREGETHRRGVHYSPNGLLETSAFPLKNKIGCTTNQGNRGTCVAFALTNSAQITAFNQRNRAFNFSEQYSYFQSEIYDDVWYDGLNTVRTVNRWANNEWPMAREYRWIYNNSFQRDGSIEEANANNNYPYPHYPKSCENYDGYCTPYSFQGEFVVRRTDGKHTWTAYHPPTVSENEDNYKASGASTWGWGEGLIRDAGLAIVKHFLNRGWPVIMSSTITSNYEADRDGYIVGKAFNNEPAILGSHASLLVGFIAKDQLPENAPRPIGEGYFIVKNSWGIYQGDCGIDYLDAAYVKTSQPVFNVLTFDNQAATPW